jgi:hypothetical protein
MLRPGRASPGRAAQRGTRRSRLRPRPARSRSSGPKLRGNDEPLVSRLLGLGVTRTKALESLVIASFVRGLSVRDVEAALAEALGEQAALSKSTRLSVGCPANRAASHWSGLSSTESVWAGAASTPRSPVCAGSRTCGDSCCHCRHRIVDSGPVAQSHHHHPTALLPAVLVALSRSAFVTTAVATAVGPSPRVSRS